MSIDLGDIGGVVAGYKAGEISQREARRLLRNYGTGDDLIDSLLSIGIGVGVGTLAGSIVNDVIDDVLGGLFD